VCHGIHVHTRVLTQVEMSTLEDGSFALFGKQVNETAFVAIACNELQQMKVKANGERTPESAAVGNH